MQTRHDAHSSPDRSPLRPSSHESSKLRELKDKVKVKTKRALHLGTASDASDGEKSPSGAAFEELNESAAFNSSKFLNKARIGPSGVPDKVIAAVQLTADIIKNPKATAKARITKNTAGKLAKSRPYLSRQADFDFLEAHDDLSRAEDTRDRNDDEQTAAKKDGDIDHYANHISEMQRRRLNMRVAWVTARHVQRVRAVDAIPPLPFLDDSFFEELDDCGFPEFNWGYWIGYKLLAGSYSFSAQYIDDFEQLPFDLDTLRRHVERLIVVSAPLQEYISDLRCVYRWENPARTGRWMVLYFLLWYISHIMTFFYGYIVFSVVKNHFYPTSLSELRASIERTIDRSATAFKVGELMDKHGSHDWLGPLMEELGPFIQVQVADLANILEASYNFYHFRSHKATIASLCLFGALFLVCALGNSKFTMKLFWFIVGFVFFVCWPISSLYPRFRLLVSPFKLALWEVPTHAEWCFQYLQERSAIAIEAILSNNHNDVTRHTNTNSADQVPNGYNPDSDSSLHSSQSTQPGLHDILSIPCTYRHIPGHLILTPTTLRFLASSPIRHPISIPHETFNKPYTSLLEMSKRQTRSSLLSPIAKVTTGMDKLELWFRGDEGGAGMHGIGEREGSNIVVLENMRERDKAFNAIIGFSGVRWQCLQRRGGKKDFGGGGNSKEENSREEKISQ